MKLIELLESKTPEDVVEFLSKHKSISSVEKNGTDSINVSTKKGDIVTFNFVDGKWYAWVQGQKHDIDCGDVGSTPTDLVSFLSGINKAWYREHDRHFND